MLPLDVPNTGVGAKAVDVDVPKRLPAPVVEGAPKEPIPLLVVLTTTPKALGVLVPLLNRLPVLVAEVDEPSVGLVMVIVVVGGEAAVNGVLPVGAEAFVVAGLILGKNGVAVFVAEKADGPEPADKLSRLLAVVVVEGAVMPGLAPPSDRPNTPPCADVIVVAGAPKMLPVTGKVLTAVVEGNVLDLLLSDRACAKMPPALVDTPTTGGVINAVVLVSLFSDGVPLEGRGP